VPDSYFKAPAVSKLQRFGTACVLALKNPAKRDTELFKAAKTALK